MNTYSNIQEVQQVANKYGIGKVFKSSKKIRNIWWRHEKNNNRFGLTLVITTIILLKYTKYIKYWAKIRRF